MWPDRVSKPGPLALESDALSTALRGLGIRTYNTAAIPWFDHLCEEIFHELNVIVIPWFVRLYEETIHEL